MMKKILSLILAVTVLLSAAVPAMATETIYTRSSKRIEAVGRLDSDGDGKAEGGQEGPVLPPELIVDLEWETMEFVYSTGEYDPDGMYFTSGWQAGSKNITVSNRSTVAITVKTVHTPAANKVNITLTNPDFELAAAATAANTVKNPGTAKKDTVEASVAADEEPISKDKESIGTITLTIAKKA